MSVNDMGDHSPLDLPAILVEKIRDDGDCWTWIACLQPNGYGKVAYRLNGGKTRTWLAHRLSYELLAGPIPDGLVIDHLCRNRACINPDHMRPVTIRENVLAAGSLSPSAVESRRTHCLPAGHPLSGSNLYVCPRGRRQCRACRQAANARYEASGRR